MKQKLNRMGFGAYELLSVALVCLLLSCILLMTILGNIDTEKFQVFCYNARIMALNAVNVQNSTDQNTVYLYQMIDNGLISPIKNPFSGDDYCDPYESKVTFQGEERTVTLQCGNYLISQENIGDSVYNIYKVGEWKEGNNQKNAETKTVYNVKIENKYLLSDFYEEDLFLSLLNDSLNSSFASLEKLEDEYDISSKEVYRSKEWVKEIDY